MPVQSHKVLHCLALTAVVAVAAGAHDKAIVLQGPLNRPVESQAGVRRAEAHREQVRPFVHGPIDPFYHRSIGPVGQAPPDSFLCGSASLRELVKNPRAKPPRRKDGLSEPRS